jgi:hypothetical protein
MEKIRIRDGKTLDLGFGINIPDPHLTTSPDVTIVTVKKKLEMLQVFIPQPEKRKNSGG